MFSVLWKVSEVGSDDYWLFLLCGLPAWVFFRDGLTSRVAEPARERESHPESPLSTPTRAALDRRHESRRVRGDARSRRRPQLLADPRCAHDCVARVPPLAALFACIVAGFAHTVASLNALYRDVEHLLAALLLPLFFLTPILYSLDQLPSRRLPVADFSSTG